MNCDQRASGKLGLPPSPLAEEGAMWLCLIVISRMVLRAESFLISTSRIAALRPQRIVAHWCRHVKPLGPI
jgi:hypothetical protein